MPRKNTRNTKGKIISAAWKLFYENGYEGTTIEDIIFASGTSRGSFYHYFDGKDALLGTDHRLGPLAGIRHELQRPDHPQLQAQGEKHLLDRNRTYFRILREIIAEGLAKKELRKDCTASEIIKAYAMWERALMYDWCLCGGEYSLVSYADRMTPMFLESFRAPAGE